MLLVIGILLWSALHLSVALTPGLRQSLIARLGLGPYKGLFAIGIVASLVIIVLGWKAFPGGVVYVPPAGMRHLTMLLMPIAVVLFISARLPNDLTRRIRHPQLSGVKLWALAHLLANGETRSVVLFTGLLAWAVMEVIAINHRDGARQLPAPRGALRSLLVVGVGLALTAALMFAHPWLAGVALLPG